MNIEANFKGTYILKLCLQFKYKCRFEYAFNMVWRSKCLDLNGKCLGFFFLKGESVLIACFGFLDVAVQVRTMLLPLITAACLVI